MATLQQMAGRASTIAWSAIIGSALLGALAGQALARRILGPAR